MLFFLPKFASQISLTQILFELLCNGICRRKPKILQQSRLIEFFLRFMGFKIYDERTKVTEILLEKVENTGGDYYAVAYRCKGDSSTHAYTSSSHYDYVDLEQDDERPDRFYATTKDGQRHTFTIGKDRIWDGYSKGFADEPLKSSSKDEADAKADRAKAKGNDSCSTSSSSICKWAWDLVCCLMKE